MIQAMVQQPVKDCLWQWSAEVLLNDQYSTSSQGDCKHIRAIRQRNAMPKDTVLVHQVGAGQGIGSRGGMPISVRQRSQLLKPACNS